MLVLAMAITAVVIPNATAKAATEYYIAGNMQGWNCQDANYKMTQSGDVYTFVLQDLAAGSWQFKVTDGTWDNAWGNGGDNYTFETTSVADATITFNPSTKAITVESNGIGKLEYPDRYLAGSYNGWNERDTAHKLVENADGSFSITVVMDAGTQEFKVTNGTWDKSWPAQNYVLELAEQSNVTIVVSADDNVTVTYEPVQSESSESESSESESSESESSESESSESESSESQSSESESSESQSSESESQTPSGSEDKSDYTPVYSAATIAGDFSALGNANITTAWDVANTAANMTHLGNGIYVYELTFDATTAEVTVNYKVAFNNAWDVAIGYDYTNKQFTTAGGSENLYITIPAGTTSVKIYADENGLVAYNTIQNPDEAAALVAIASKGDMNMVAIYMVLFAGAALVAVGAISKKKFA